MKAAFAGIENKILPFAKILQKTHNYKKDDGITICGVIGPDIESTTNTAIKLNVKAYADISDMFKEADIIFVCHPDKHLAAFCEIVKENHVRNKILCHFSTKYDSSVLYCGSTNTCYAIGFPYPVRVGETCSDDIIISLEGEGKRSEEFEQIIRKNFAKARFCSKNEKRLGMLGARIISEYLKFIISIARKFYKMAGLYDEVSFGQFASHSVRDITHDKCENIKIRKRSESDIRQDMRLLSIVNYSDSRDFYKNMETHIADTGAYPPSEKDTILRVLKRKS
ncbi:MAG: hypothetical protein IJ454_01305 [Clostridia bacterium]|nr:hypothetical protein [Clostridia bacterium]